MKKKYVSGALCFLLASSVAMAATENLIALHKNAANLSKKECLACHKSILNEPTQDKKIKTFHRLHLESNLDTPKECSDCHQSIDLRESSAGALRKQVDPQLCAGCHSGDMTGAKVLFSRQEG